MPKQKGSIDLKTSGYLYGQISSLESQVDGQIQTWAQDTNPASNWSADEKANRVGDLWLFTGTSDNTTIQQGLTLHPQGIYKYVYDSANSIYKWEAHSSTNNNIFDLADGKKRVFYGTTLPSTPYDLNDVWVQGSGGDIKVCRTARSSGSGASSDWVLASKYTNDDALITWVSNTYATDKENIQGQIDGKAETFYQSADPALNWSSTEKPKHEGDLWYDTDDGTTWYYAQISDNPVSYGWSQQNIPDAVFDSIDGKATIFTGTQTPSNPSKGDLWFKGATEPILTYINNSWIEYNKYTDDSTVTNFINNTYSTDKDNILNQLDKKAETWYQDDDPSDDWVGYESEHEGDLWYDTTDGTTWYYAKQGTNPETYAWEQQNIPTSVFNTINGKSSIYISQPSSYKVGDLWVNATYPSSSPYTYQNDILRCTTTSNSFNINHWTLASKYTDDSRLDTFLTQYSTDQSNMQGLIEDSKLETYYQSSDPSSNWSTSNYSKHTGDLWYYTGTTTSTLKQNATYRWNGTQWEQQDVPKEVFDQIDGKKDIRYTNKAPIRPPYNAGDLWSNGIDLRICITPKADGESYSISDWVLASNYIDSADATSIASTEANKTKTTETKTLYYISTSSNEPTGGSWVDETTITTADVLNKYLFVKIQNKINGSWVDATPSPGYQKSNLYNGIYTFANTVAGDSGLTTINGSKITTGRIQDSTGKNFIQIANDGTTTAGHLEFKDTSSWSTANQGIQWNSSQGQLNIKGHITAKSLTIDGTGGSYNAYDAINISGYSIEITTEPATSISTNNVYLYPHLYHNGVEVFYILTSDTTAQSGKTYYYYNSTTSSYVAYTTAPQNPKSSNAYESIDYTKFHWYRNNSSSYETGDTNNFGRLLCVFTDKIKVTYTFDDGASDGGMTAMEVTVDDSKYITRIDNSSINIHPENTSGNSITLNSSGANLASGKYLINGSDWAVALSDKYTRSSAGDLNWSSTTEGDAKVIAKSALAFWNGAYSGTSSNLSKCSTGNIIGSNGGTMTGQLKTSFKQSVAMGSYGSAQSTIEGLVGEVRYSSGCSGSASIGTAYTLSGVTIPTGWYNFSWMPHRSGGVNGASSGDNCNYGNLLLFGMNNTNGRFIIRVSSSEIQEVVRLITTAEFTDYITTQGSDTNGWKWRIWYSGRIEAWCTHTWTNVACTTSAGGGYRSGDVTLALPTSLFSTVESCQATMHGSGGSGYAMTLRTLSSNTTSISQMFWNTVSATKTTCTVDYYVTGI